MRLNRDNLFLQMDRFLPRSLAILPYMEAYKRLYMTLIPLPDVELWTRNSIQRGNFVFGLSDLDLTIVLSHQKAPIVLPRVLNELKSTKGLYRFLGETNIYLKEEIPFFLPCLNIYERERDPQLSSKLHPIVEIDLQVEKIVFILRMIYSDKKKLYADPVLRQKKWREHFSILGFECPELITADIVLDKLFEVMNLNTDEKKGAQEALSAMFSTSLTDQEVLKADMPPSWKFLFPHKYLWYDRDRPECLKSIKGSILEKICLRQMDWEIWGLFSQLPYLKSNEKGFLLHLDRLMKANWELTGNIKYRTQALRLIKLEKALK